MSPLLPKPPRLGRRRWPPEGSPRCRYPGLRSFAAVPLTWPGCGTSRSPRPLGTWGSPNHACTTGWPGPTSTRAGPRSRCVRDGDDPASDSRERHSRRGDGLAHAGNEGDPAGPGAHIEVRSQIRATLSGTVPTPGSVTASAKSVALKVACTSATGMPKAPKLASSSELKVTSRLTLQGLPALPLAPSARDPPVQRAAAADRLGPTLPFMRLARPVP